MALMVDEPIPDGYGTVTPWIISPDTARLIDYLTAAFGAAEIARVELEDGSIGHAEVRIGTPAVPRLARVVAAPMAGSLRWCRRV